MNKWVTILVFGYMIAMTVFLFLPSVKRSDGQEHTPLQQQQLPNLDLVKTESKETEADSENLPSERVKISEPHDEIWYIKGLKNGEIKSLESIPRNTRTTAVCLTALRQDIEVDNAIIPDASWTTEVAMAFAEKEPRKLHFIPEQLMSVEIAKAGIKKWSGALRLIPFEMVNREMAEFALECDLVEAFSAIPDSLKTPELCLRAVHEKPETLRYVPWELRTLELCHVALTNSNDAWDWVPKKYAILPIKK